ncbi:unnamed protein product [Discosporangium mesarthrocarpum]
MMLRSSLMMCVLSTAATAASTARFISKWSAWVVVPGAVGRRMSYEARMSDVRGGEGPKKIVFLGTPDVAARSLELLVGASRGGRGGGFEIVRVVSNPPARAGRKKILQPSPVQALAENEGIPVMTPTSARDEGFLLELEELRPDLCVTAAYGQFLPQRFLDIPTLGTLNVHPSLLPHYRGASPVQRCVEMGDTETGVTVAFTVLKMDAGPIVRQTVRKLNGDEKTPELLLSLFEEGTEQLIDCLPLVWDGSIKTRPQDDEAATKARKITVEEARCCFKTNSAFTIHNKVRAFAGWPGTWALLSSGEGKDAEPNKVKLVTTEIGKENPDGGDSSKNIVLRNGALEIQCGDGSVLRVLELQPPGRKVMDAKSFVNGLRGAQLTWVELEPLVPTG